MIIGDGADRLSITLVEVDRPEAGYTSLRLRVEVSSRGFAGANDSVWLSTDDFTRFLDDLRALERTRRGEAGIESMSPSDLRLRVWVRDAAGHISAEGFLGSVSHGDTGAAVEVKVGFSIDVDPTRLAKTLDALADLPAG